MLRMMTARRGRWARAMRSLASAHRPSGGARSDRLAQDAAAAVAGVLSRRLCSAAAAPPPPPASPPIGTPAAAAAAANAAANATAAATAAAAAGSPPGFYQRPLPSHLVSFASNAGRQIFAEALASGGMEGYFALAQQFQTQSEPAYCGPTSLSMILNALGLDPNRIWKGSWRWFSEDMLIDRTRSAPMQLLAAAFGDTAAAPAPGNPSVPAGPLAKIQSEGLSFEEFLFLAECNGSRIQGIYATDATEEAFRSAILAATSRTDLHCVVSFARHVLGQTGSGHYSPIGGYHAERDLVLILDVARFKYPPYWVPVSLMWKAMLELDPSTQRPRGYFLMSRGPSLHTSYPPLSSSCQIAVDKASWSALAEHFCVVLPPRLAALKPTEPKHVFAEILSSLPVEATSVFTMYTHDLSARQHEQHAHHPRNYQFQPTPRASDSAAAAAAVDPATASAAPASAAAGSGAAQYTVRAVSPLPSLDSLPLLPGATAATTAAATGAATGAAAGAGADAANVRKARAISMALPSSASHDWTSPLPAVVEQELSQTKLFRMIQDLYTPASLRAGAGTVFRLKQKYSLAGAVTHASSRTTKCVELQLATLLLLACPEQVFSLLPPALRTAIDSVRNVQRLNVSEPVRQEVASLRQQMGILADYCMCSDADPTCATDAAPAAAPTASPTASPSHAAASTPAAPASAAAAAAAASRSHSSHSHSHSHSHAHGPAHGASHGPSRSHAHSHAPAPSRTRTWVQPHAAPTRTAAAAQPVTVTTLSGAATPTTHAVSASAASSTGAVGAVGAVGVRSGSKGRRHRFIADPSAPAPATTK